MKPERIVVAGAGALGSIYGGVLTAAGADVVLLARGAHADALRTRPLTMHLPGREIEVPVRVAHEADGDIVILTSKAFDTAAVLAQVRGEARLAETVTSAAVST